MPMLTFSQPRSTSSPWRCVTSRRLSNMSGSREDTGPQWPFGTGSESQRQKVAGTAPASSSTTSNPPNKPFGSCFTNSTAFPSQLFSTVFAPDATKAQPATSTTFPSSIPKLPTWQTSSARPNITFGQVSRSASPFAKGEGGQPTSDAITQIQSEASLFPRATSVVSSVPPKFGSGAASVTVAPNAALPMKPVSNKTSKSPVVATQSIKPKPGTAVIQPASMNLLRGGTTVRIVVGTQAGEFSSNDSSHVWDLEPVLISHYSQKLRSACDRKRNSNERICITLPEDDPYIFELFYMWMLDGTTIGRTTSLVARNQAVNLDAQAWILGDQLRSVDFKNYAMSRLYDQYATYFSPKAISPKDVAYAFKHSSADSKLRQFYLDLFPKQWKNMPCVSNNVEEWDEIVHDHKDFRMRFYDGMRPDKYAKNAVLLKQTYMELEETSTADTPAVANMDQVIPAKRKAEDVLVKEEATGD